MKKHIKLKLFFIIYTILIGIGSGQEVIQNIEFFGNEHFSDNQLQNWSGLRIGSVVNNDVIMKGNHKMIAGYQGEGYLFARIDSTILNPETEAKKTDIKWYINEGDLVRLGKIRIVAEVLSQEDLENMLDFNEGDIYRKDLIESELMLIGQFYAENGYPLATINIVNARLRPEDGIQYIDLEIKCISGPEIRINKIIVSGNQITQDQVILRELNISSGEKYNQKKIDQIQKQLNHLGYFSEILPVKAIGFRNGKTDLLIEVKETNTTTFDGIVGYIPSSPNNLGQEGYFTGLINLNFRNLFGTGRKFEVKWRKPDNYSEEFRIFYEEPWIFNVPINLGGGIERVVRDTTYIERSYFLNSTFKLSAEFKGFLNFNHKEVIPDSLASRNLRLTRNSIVEGEIGVTYDTRDQPINPRNGLQYMTSFSFGTKKNKGPGYLIREDSLALNEDIRKIKVQFSYFLNLWQNQVFALNFYGAHIEGNKNRLQISDHFWFGGFGSLRGYRENQFHGTTISWINLEYRFLISSNSRVFVFNDWGFYQFKDVSKIKKDILSSYGFGIRFETPLGIMGVDYGLGRGDSFSTGKIHFGIINSF